MDVALGGWSWIGLAAVLFLTTFGSSGAIWLLMYAASFFIGTGLVLMKFGAQRASSWTKTQDSLAVPPPRPGLSVLLGCVGVRQKAADARLMDKRMTGSGSIDEVLLEILDHIYRDYIHSWYMRLSDDDSFKYDINKTIRDVVRSFSDRAKEVDLVPFLTTRLVDDFASHIRLYRRTKLRVREHQKDDTMPLPDMESIFFDLEAEMEGTICRDMICLSEKDERQYLQDLTEVLMFLLLPAEDFHNKPFRYIVKEVLVNGVFLPAINLLSDPDFINQNVAYWCKENMFTNETFLTMLKFSDCLDELLAVKEKVDLDVARQRSKDTGQANDTEIKQRLSSLLFVRNLCTTRMQQLAEGVDELDALLPQGLDLSKLMSHGHKLYALPFEVIVSNKEALPHFIEYMKNIGAQKYLFFYLNIESFRVTATEQLSAELLNCEGNSDKLDLESIRESALCIFEEYLGEKASPRLKVDDQLVRTLREKLHHEIPSESVFDEIQKRVLDMLENEEQFLPAFRKSQMYIKLLNELDLLKDLERPVDFLLAEEDGGSNSSRSGSLRASREDLSSVDSQSSVDAPVNSGASVLLKPGAYTLTANITTTGVNREHGKPYGVYLIHVVRQNSDGTSLVWDVPRRFNDFYDFHLLLTERLNDSLPGLTLPAKKLLNSISKDVLEKRKATFNAYLQGLLNPSFHVRHKDLLELVNQFLENPVWERDKLSSTRKPNDVSNQLRSSVKNVGNFVKSVPDSLADGVAKVSGGLRNNVLEGVVGKMMSNVKAGGAIPTIFTSILPFGQNSVNPMPAVKSSSDSESKKVSASLDIERDEDNIPLRIMMLLMDEVFDLKDRNQWLRRRIVAILRQIVKTMFGDSINRKIVEYVQLMTSADQIAEYLKTFKESFWPGGILSDTRPLRDHNTKMRMRLVCKAKMYGGITDDLRHLISAETCRQGVTLVFNMFQHQKLNRRLLYVVLEGILETLFPDNKFDEVFRKLHSRSTRARRKGDAGGASGPSSFSKGGPSSFSKCAGHLSRSASTKSAASMSRVHERVGLRYRES